MKTLTYTVGDSTLTSREFIDLVQRVWPGEYDASATASALTRTINVTARDGPLLIGAVRVLSDGYYFGTIPELLVDPSYQGRGVGRRLMELAWQASPSSLYFGAQPGKEAFYEKLGYERSLQSFFRRKPRR
ncbi:MAG: GNAT family N-acetyltransferase [Pseudomonadales bacterium]